MQIHITGEISTFADTRIFMDMLQHTFMCILHERPYFKFYSFLSNDLILRLKEKESTEEPLTAHGI